MSSIDRIEKLTGQYEKEMELAEKHRNRGKEHMELAEKHTKKAGNLEKQIKYEKGGEVFDRVNALNLTPEELMERFVRGDQSRNTEGSGLGLNIAKSLVELMRGEFRLHVDGDLFKAEILLPRLDPAAASTPGARPPDPTAL